MDRLTKRSSAAPLAMFCAAHLLFLSSCAGPTGEKYSDGPSTSIGLAHIQLSVDPDALTSDVEYQITGNRIVPIKGVMLAIPGTSAIGVIVNLPTGNGYSIFVRTTVTAANPVTCTATAMFDVSSIQATDLPLTLQCTDSIGGGGSFQLGGDAGLVRNADGGLPSDAGVQRLSESGALSSFTVDTGVADAARSQLPDAGAPRDAGSSAADASVESCAACSARLCPEQTGIDPERECYRTNGLVAYGPAAGNYRFEVCQTLMDCARKTGCAQFSAEDCYCGERISTESCLQHGPIGMCRGAYEAAGENVQPDLLIGDGRMGRSTLLDVALPLLTCEADLCKRACYPATAR